MGFVKYIIVFLLLISHFIESKLTACPLDERDTESNKVHKIKFSFQRENFKALPKEILKEILDFSNKTDILQMRQAENHLKLIIDSEYLANKHFSIEDATSSPVIEDIKDLPFKDVSLSFRKWAEKDIERLLFFKSVEKLCLGKLSSLNFATCELFNQYPCAYFTSCFMSFVNSASNFLLGKEIFNTPSLYLTVTFLDLSHSKIGDWGVICFVSNFKSLKTLNLSNNDIGRNVRDEANVIAAFKTLTSLDISRNYFSSKTVQQILQLTNLRVLNISHNFIADKMLIQKLGELPKLQNFLNEEQKEEKNYEHYRYFY